MFSLPISHSLIHKKIYAHTRLQFQSPSLCLCESNKTPRNNAAMLEKVEKAEFMVGLFKNGLKRDINLGLLNAFYALSFFLAFLAKIAHSF